MMDKDTAELILRFLERTELRGGEVPAFNKCVAELQKIVKPPVVVEDE